MLDGADLIYTYDGSFDGLMCCVFESYFHKEEPFDIRLYDAHINLFECLKRVETDLAKAERVRRGIVAKISYQALKMVQMGYLTDATQKEMLIYRFLRLGFEHGKKTVSMLADDRVHGLYRAVRNLTNESHKFLGFVRFSAYDQVLVSVIEPQNYILPLISEHFCERFSGEKFMIYDKSHQMALIHEAGEATLIDVDELTLPDPSEEEQEFRRLWKQFYDTVAIKERNNPRCRMNHMPKRYWAHLVEVQGE